MEKSKNKQIKNVLLLGSGAREHAIAQVLKKSSKLNALYILPGNPGTASLGINIDFALDDHQSISDFVVQKEIDIVVCGPEQPLAEGLIDFLSADDRNFDTIFIGPKAKGAELESSKSFAKAFMARNHIPTAGYKSFSVENIEEGLDFISSLQPPIVLKADGLAAGKGVLICTDHPEAETEFIAMLNGKYGTASKKVVVEQFLDGIEFSVFILTNGEEYILLPEAKDYKRIGEGDTGLNTGGMGSISPVSFATEEIMEKVKRRIIEPTMRGLQAEQIDYQGFIFFGLILVKGDPYLIEYNCRMGDPETESVFPRIQSDIIELFEAVNEKRLGNFDLRISPNTAATIMLVSKGYPEKFEKGFEIQLPEIEAQDIFLYHAGTAMKNDKLVTNGGRVIAVTSIDENQNAALKKSMAIADKIQFEGKCFRRDIGYDL